MRDRTHVRSPSFRSDNRKSKIENLKWLGLSVIVFVLVATVVVAEARQPKKITRIGYLSDIDPTRESVRSDGIRLALRELGYIEGQNIALSTDMRRGSKIGFLRLRPN